MAPLAERMAPPAAKKLVVCGGSGFLGSRICKFAVQRGWDVTSIRLVVSATRSRHSSIMVFYLTLN